MIDDKLVIFEIPEQTELSKTFATIKIYDKVLSRKLKHRFDELWE